ncbi:hypothetical protein [Nostoc sp. LPT]|uniref:hypothetical protein n=1 Tax=Nostoc sp. LPT TaxID=2815387 RepID=UPI001DC44BD4|nr:hypothetical protein [Nostoc sp. LPT]MBN4004770.1 hypothetical protein [Nostoc sp. LPT]
MHTIINTPSVFTCKTPSEGWINFAQVRQLQHEEYPKNVVVLTWHNGDRQTFTGVNAAAILQAWEQATALLEQRCNCNHRLKNRRSG